MLSAIDRERDGAIIDASLIKSCVELFEAMGMGTLDVYATDFEEQLLTNTREYDCRVGPGNRVRPKRMRLNAIGTDIRSTGAVNKYSRKSQEWIETDDTPSYMIKAEQALDEEKSRVARFLNASTESKLLQVCMEEMLQKREVL